MPEPRALPASTYDAVPYESHVFAQSHPNRLATMALLLGLRPAPVTKSRVLEIGCASGGNIIPMAVGLPESTFVGIDLSARQIEAGKQIVDALKLTNIELRQEDLRNVSPQFGQFDYIVCHGVYSWVPREAQDHILRICTQNLAPRGVAYVSYNTYPGWHMRGIIRDMMMYQSKHFADPLVRVRQARNLPDFMAKTVVQKDDPYSLLLKNEVELIRQCRDAYLFHDHLEDENNPVYFHDFAERAAKSGLQYLGEVDFRVMLAGNYPAEVQSVLAMLSPDAIHLEQYMDFLRNRMFRQTLLCHASMTLTPQVRPEVITQFSIASPSKPLAEKPDVRSTEPEKFEGLNGTTVTTGQPFFKAAWTHLGRRWPQAVPFAELVNAARAQLDDDNRPQINQDARTLAEGFLNCYASASGSMVELQLTPLPFARDVGEKPLASPLARWQADEGSTRVTNLRHESVNIHNVDRLLLKYLDGTRDLAGLNEAVVELAAHGDFTVRQHGEIVAEPDKVRELAGPIVVERLNVLAQNALLVR